MAGAPHRCPAQIGSARFKRIITPQGAPAASVIEFTNPGARLYMTLVLQDQQCDVLPVDQDSYQTGLLLVEKDGTLTAFSGWRETSSAKELMPVNAIITILL